MDNPDDKPQEPRTVFSPKPPESASPAGHEPAHTDPIDDWFAASEGPAKAGTGPVEAAAIDTTSEPWSEISSADDPAADWSAPAAAAWPGPAERAPWREEPPEPRPFAKGRLRPGDLLNNIFQVRRFIARGGMGEVYEGFNVNTDERVAIKIMLAHLATDSSALKMFIKEARALLGLSNDAVMQYRVLAQEPTLELYYIVTEYIDGPALSDQMADIRPSASQLSGLIRRLALGLDAAHRLNLVHRDMSPDNVLLPGGRLDQAKIIDFGIAKDLDPTKGTIVGDGFAGKLSFVAPEQFGEYGGEIGPWTDVYSLGLVALAVAKGRAADMGATVSDALQRRREGPDLSDAPEHLRPLLADMLAPDPQRRLRSMDHVIAGLDRADAAPAQAAARTPAGDVRARILPAAPPGLARLAVSPRAIAYMAAGVGVVVLAIIAIAVMSNRPREAVTAAAGPPSAAASAAGPAVPLTQAIDSTLANIDCSWLDLDRLPQGQSGPAVQVSGVAGDPGAVSQAVATAAKAAETDTSRVETIPPSACPILNALRPLRVSTAARGRSLMMAQSVFTLESTPPAGCDLEKVPQAKLVTDITIGDPGLDFTLIGVEPSGNMQQLIKGRSDMSALSQNISPLAGDAFRLWNCVDGATANATPNGLAGFLLIKGRGPFDLGLPGLSAPGAAAPPADWAARLRDGATNKGWQAEMVWYRVAPPAG